MQNQLQCWLIYEWVLLETFSNMLAVVCCAQYAYRGTVCTQENVTHARYCPMVIISTQFNLMNVEFNCKIFLCTVNFVNILLMSLFLWVISLRARRGYLFIMFYCLRYTHCLVNWIFISNEMCTGKHMVNMLWSTSYE